MNAALVSILSIILFYLGYRYYSKFIQNKVFALNDNHDKTPSHEFNDSVDYVPTKKHILFGHHFTSIAGAAPIIGPCIAVFWGWVPAIIWVVFGTIFIGAVHDFGALLLSVKEKGKSVADISSKVINKRVRILFLFFVMMLTWLVLAVFSLAIAGLFIKNPTSVLPINIEIIIALVMGYLIYKQKINSLIPSIIALLILYLFIWIGTKYPLSLDMIGLNNSQNTWVLLLFIYSSIASLLPVWLLLQPRDYINSHQLMVGLGLIYLAIFIVQPEIVAPALNINSGGPPIIPFLFVTIACGAISGFHGLVSSGTTSKQVDKLSDTRMIGYGSMIGEGTLALASVIAAVAGIAFVTNCTVNGTFMANLTWDAYYDTWEHAVNNKALAFVLGGAALLEQIGFSNLLATTLISVLVISFAATTLDTATRIQRFIIIEIGHAVKINFLKNRIVATILGVLPAYILTINGTAWDLWPVFGASNQMLAALTLMILCIYFWKKGTTIIPIIIPMLLIMSITLISLYIKTKDFIAANNTTLATINIVLLMLVFWMIVEGIYYLLNYQKNNESN